MNEQFYPTQTKEELGKQLRSPVSGVVKIFSNKDAFAPYAEVGTYHLVRMSRSLPTFAEQSLRDLLPEVGKALFIILGLPENATREAIRQRIIGGVVIELHAEIRKQGVVTDEGKRPDETDDEYKKRRKLIRNHAYFVTKYYQNPEKRTAVQDRVRENIRQARASQRARDEAKKAVLRQELTAQDENIPEKAIKRFQPTVPEGIPAGPIQKQVLDILDGSDPTTTVPYEEIRERLYGTADELATGRTKKAIQNASKTLAPYGKKIGWYATWTERYAGKRGQYFIADLKKSENS